LKPEAPARDKIDPVSLSDCDQQTWPYITHQCLAERKEVAQRKVRVITTDKIARRLSAPSNRDGRMCRVMKTTHKKKSPAPLAEPFFLIFLELD
jgi:hypothetical protein